MKIDFSQVLDVPDPATTEALTLAKVARAALNAPGREPLAFDQAFRRGSLALAVGEGGEHDISPEDAALIRSQLPAVWSPIVVTLAARMLEG